MRMFGTGGSVQMELITSLASAASLGRGSMLGFNNSIKTLRDLLLALRMCVTLGLALQARHL